MISEISCFCYVALRSYKQTHPHDSAQGGMSFQAEVFKTFIYNYVDYIPAISVNIKTLWKMQWHLNTQWSVITCVHWLETDSHLSIGVTTA